jgi:phosphopantetheinyl transferase (holo-ACP synthase)
MYEGVTDEDGRRTEQMGTNRLVKSMSLCADDSCSTEVRVVVLRGASSWGAHQTGRIDLPHGTFAVAYDEREAPYVPGEQVLVSLTDEGDYLACAWALHARESKKPSLVGVGVDLCSASDFEPRPGMERITRLMFSNQEHAIARALCERGSLPGLPFAYAALFGAKEAAFKATAHPLRVWYAKHDENLEFEVRDFGMAGLEGNHGLERGELRHGAAQLALDRMGIERIDVTFEPIDHMALVVARAYSAR